MRLTAVITLPSLPRRYLVTAVLAAAAAVPCVAVLSGHYLLDLDIYREGGRAARIGHGLYSFHVRRYSFTYPPFAALLFVPLSWMTLGVAAWVVTLTSVACLVVFVRLAVPDLVARAYVGRSILPAGALAALTICEPVVSTLWNGQINLVLGALVLYDSLVLRKGVLIGLAAAIKLTPAVFVVYLLIRGRRREARNAIATFVGLCAAAGLLLPTDSMRFWTRTMFSGAGIGDLTRPANQSLRGVLERAVGPHTGTAVWAFLVVPTLAGGLALARQVGRAGREQFALGLVGVTGCLVSPVSWTHHWIWCVPMLGGLWTVAVDRGRTARIGALGCGAIFVSGELDPNHLHPHDAAWGYIVDNLFVLAAVLVFVGCAGVACRDRRFLALVGVECQTRVGTRLL